MALTLASLARLLISALGIYLGFALASLLFAISAFIAYFIVRSLASAGVGTKSGQAPYGGAAALGFDAGALLALAVVLAGYVLSALWALLAIPLALANAARRALMAYWPWLLAAVFILALALVTDSYHNILIASYARFHTCFLAPLTDIVLLFTSPLTQIYAALIPITNEARRIIYYMVIDVLAAAFTCGAEAFLAFVQAFAAAIAEAPTALAIWARGDLGAPLEVAPDFGAFGQLLADSIASLEVIVSCACAPMTHIIGAFFMWFESPGSALADELGAADANSLGGFALCVNSTMNLAIVPATQLIILPIYGLVKFIASGNSNDLRLPQTNHTIDVVEQFFFDCPAGAVDAAAESTWIASAEILEFFLGIPLAPGRDPFDLFEGSTSLPGVPTPQIARGVFEVAMLPLEVIRYAFNVLFNLPDALPIVGNDRGYLYFRFDRALSFITDGVRLAMSDPLRWLADMLRDFGDAAAIALASDNMGVHPLAGTGIWVNSLGNDTHIILPSDMTSITPLAISIGDAVNVTMVDVAVTFEAIACVIDQVTLLSTRVVKNVGDVGIGVVWTAVELDNPLTFARRYFGELGPNQLWGAWECRDGSTSFSATDACGNILLNNNFVCGVDRVPPYENAHDPLEVVNNSIIVSIQAPPREFRLTLAPIVNMFGCVGNAFATICETSIEVAGDNSTLPSYVCDVFRCGAIFFPSIVVEIIHTVIDALVHIDAMATDRYYLCFIRSTELVYESVANATDCAATFVVNVGTMVRDLRNLVAGDLLHPLDTDKRRRKRDIDPYPELPTGCAPDITGQFYTPNLECTLSALVVNGTRLVIELAVTAEDVIHTLSIASLQDSSYLQQVYASLHIDAFLADGGTPFSILKAIVGSTFGQLIPETAQCSTGPTGITLAQKIVYAITKITFGILAYPFRAVNIFLLAVVDLAQDTLVGTEMDAFFLTNLFKDEAHLLGFTLCVDILAPTKDVVDCLASDQSHILIQILDAFFDGICRLLIFAIDFIIDLFTAFFEISFGLVILFIDCLLPSFGPCCPEDPPITCPPTCVADSTPCNDVDLLEKGFEDLINLVWAALEALFGIDMQEIYCVTLVALCDLGFIDEPTAEENSAIAAACGCATGDVCNSNCPSSFSCASTAITCSLNSDGIIQNFCCPEYQRQCCPRSFDNCIEAGLSADCCLVEDDDDDMTPREPNQCDNDCPTAVTFLKFCPLCENCGTTCDTTCSFKKKRESQEEKRTLSMGQQEYLQQRNVTILLAMREKIERRMRESAAHYISVFDRSSNRAEKERQQTMMVRVLADKLHDIRDEAREEYGLSEKLLYYHMIELSILAQGDSVDPQYAGLNDGVAPLSSSMDATQYKLYYSYKPFFGIVPPRHLTIQAQSEGTKVIRTSGNNFQLQSQSLAHSPGTNFFGFAVELASRFQPTRLFMDRGRVFGANMARRSAIIEEFHAERRKRTNEPPMTRLERFNALLQSRRIDPSDAAGVIVAAFEPPATSPVSRSRPQPLAHPALTALANSVEQLSHRPTTAARARGWASYEVASKRTRVAARQAFAHLFQQVRTRVSLQSVRDDLLTRLSSHPLVTSLGSHKRASEAAARSRRWRRIFIKDNTKRSDPIIEPLVSTRFTDDDNMFNAIFNLTFSACTIDAMTGLVTTPGFPAGVNCTDCAIVDAFILQTSRAIQASLDYYTLDADDPFAPHYPRAALDGMYAVVTARALHSAVNNDTFLTVRKQTPPLLTEALFLRSPDGGVYWPWRWNWTDFRNLFNMDEPTAEGGIRRLNGTLVALQRNRRDQASAANGGAYVRDTDIVIADTVTTLAPNVTATVIDWLEWGVETVIDAVGETTDVFAEFWLTWIACDYDGAAYCKSPLGIGIHDALAIVIVLGTIAGGLIACACGACIGSVVYMGIILPLSGISILWMAYNFSPLCLATTIVPYPALPTCLAHDLNQLLSETFSPCPPIHYSLIDATSEHATEPCGWCNSTAPVLNCADSAGMRDGIDVFLFTIEYLFPGSALQLADLIIDEADITESTPFDEATDALTPIPGSADNSTVSNASTILDEGFGNDFFLSIRETAERFSVPGATNDTHLQLCAVIQAPTVGTTLVVFMLALAGALAATFLTLSFLVALLPIPFMGLAIGAAALGQSEQGFAEELGAREAESQFDHQKAE